MFQHNKITLSRQVKRANQTGIIKAGYFFFILLLISTQILAQNPDKEGSLVKWMTLHEAMEKQKEQPKPMIIDFYTDWCGWCKTMMRTTYANPGLASYINTYFYPVKFDAEGKDTVEYLGEKYIPTGERPRTPHPLTVKLLNNKLMYPTTLFLNGYDKTKNEFALSMIASGYLEADKLEPILIFMLENAGRNSTYDDFRDNFNITFFDSTLEARQKKVKWLSASEAFGRQEQVKKKMLVMVNPAWCNSCKVMKAASFSDTAISSYLAGKFTLVDFNPELKDTLHYKGTDYVYPQSAQAPFHQLAFVLARNTLNFPTLIVLDENGETLDVVPSYIPPKFLNDIIHFYGEDIYKNKPWQEYIRTKDKS